MSHPTTPLKRTVPVEKVSTPIRSGSASSGRFSSLAPPTPPKLVKANFEMEGHWNGPIPIAEFLDRLPKAQAKCPEISYAPFQDIFKGEGQETKMYEPMIEALKPFTPNLQFLDTSAHTHPVWGKPDVTGYRLGANVSKEQPLNFKEAVINMEFKTRERDNPHRIENFLPQSQEAQKARGQLTQYATGIGACQFRTHIFNVLIMGEMCRLYCWDRGKVDVTEPFDYTKEPHLVDFFWRFSEADDAGRGYDTSANCPILPDEESAARKLLGVSNDAPLSKLTVNDESGDKFFIVSEPLPGFKYSPHGRGTLPYHAYDCKSRKRVVLKRTWRVDGYTPEHETYKKLEEHDVPNIPRVIAAGDVLIDGKPQVCRGMGKDGRVFTLYAIVLNIVGKPLDQFTSIYEAIRAVHCAFIAHRMAVEKAQILHLDISVGNIIITEDGGALIDWEMARSLDVAAQRSKVKTGTWQFLSVRVLLGGAHLPGDDIESFFHVLVWMTIRFVPNSMAPNDRSTRLQSYDADGTDTKLAHLKAGAGAINGIHIHHSPLQDLLSAVAAQLACRYDEQRLEFAMWKQQAEKLIILARVDLHGWFDNTFKEWLKSTPKDNVAAQRQDLALPKPSTKRASTRESSGAHDSGESGKRRRMAK